MSWWKEFTFKTTEEKKISLFGNTLLESLRHMALGRAGSVQFGRVHVDLVRRATLH